MTKRKKLIAANWKMCPAPVALGAPVQGKPSMEALKAYRGTPEVDAIVFPTFLDIPKVLKAGLIVGAQYGHPEESGAHTGDVSMKMVKDAGCTHVLCGHSERRKDHGETNTFVAAQVLSALKNDLHPILCIGETWEEKKAGHSKKVVQEQLDIVLRALPSHDSPLTIAYEPVWAISGGDATKPAASAAEAEEMHAFIRELLKASRHAEPFDKLRTGFVEARILYGGSMKPENAEELLRQPNIDGGLVGGASLDPVKFQKIVETAAKHS